MPVQDVFDRTVNTTIEDLKNALLGEIGKEKNAQKDDNTEQLKRLNDNLEKIVGTDLERELKALNKLTKKVADNYKEVADKKNNRADMEKQAAAFGKAVAKSVKPTGGGGDISKSIEKTLKKLDPAFDRMTDKTMTFGKVLENSQRRFSVAFGQVGKQFQKDFGGIGEAIRSRINKLNPFKEFQKSAAESGSKFVGYFRGAISDFKKEWKLNATAAWMNVKDGWNYVTKGISSAWNTTTKYFKDSFSDFIKEWKLNSSIAWSYVKDAWANYGKPAFDIISWPFKKLGQGFKAASNKLYQYIDPIGKAAASTVKDLFKLGKGAEVAAIEGKKAGKDVDDMTGKGTKRGMEGEGTPVKGGTRAPRVAGGTSDLCRCICRCIDRLMGVTKEGVETAKDDVAISAQDLKQTKQTGKVTAKTAGGGMKGKMANIAAGAAAGGGPGAAIAAALAAAELKQEQKAKKQERREIWAARGDAARKKIIGATEAAARFIFSEKPEEALLQGIGQAIAKSAGKLVQAPFWLVGTGLAELGGLIPVVGGVFQALGGVVKVFGAALGGLAEGMIALVLTPLVRQVEYMSDASSAMFVSTGATRTTPKGDMSGFGAPKTGKEWSDTSKRVAEFNSGVDNASRTLDKLGVEMDAVKETGTDYTVIQQRMLKNFKKGVRETQTLNKVTKTGLQTAFLLNADAASTSDLFLDWHQRLGMSATDLRGMQRGMTQIARSTGLIGDDLIAVAKSSQQFLENMRLSGTLTTGAAKSIIELQARGKTTGTEKIAGTISKIFSQGILRGKLTGKELTMATVMGGGEGEGPGGNLTQAIIQGTVAGNKELEARAIKNLGKYAESQIGAILKERFDPTKDLNENMKKMTRAEMAHFTYLMGEIMDVGGEELRIGIQNVLEGSKTFAQRINDLNKSTKAEAMSVDQLKEITGKEIGWREKFEAALKETGDKSQAIQKLLDDNKLPKALRRQLEDELGAQQKAFGKEKLLLDTGADLVDTFNKNIADTNKSFEEIVADLGANNVDFREYFKEIGTDASKGGEAIQKSLMDQADRMNKAAKDIGKEDLIKNLMPSKEDIAKAIAGKDKAALKNIASDLARASGVLQVQQKVKVDPMAEFMQMMKELRGWFEAWMSHAIFKTLPFIVAALDDIAKQPFWTAFSEGKFQEGFKLLGEYIKGIMPNIIKAMGQVRELSTTPEFQKFLSAIIEAVATIADPMMNAIGAWIRAKAPELAKLWDEFNLDNFIKSVKEVAEAIKDTIKFLWDWKWVILAVVGVLIGAGGLLSLLGLGGGGLASALGSVLGVLAGPVGLIAVIVGGAYLIWKAIDGWDEAFSKMAGTLQKASQEAADAGVRSLSNSNNLSKQSDLDIKKAQETAAARQNEVAGKRTMYDDSLSVKTAKLLPGGREAAFWAESTLREQEKQTKREALAAKAAGEMKNATPEDQAKIYTKLITDSFEKQQHQAIALAEAPEAMTKMMEEQKRLLAEVNKLRNIHMERGIDYVPLSGNISRMGSRTTGVLWDKLFSDKKRSFGETGEETELQDVESDLKDAVSALNTSQRRFLTKKNEKGEDVWATFLEVGTKMQQVVKETDKSSLDTFKRAKTIGALQAAWSEIDDPLKKAYLSQADSAEGISESMKLAEQNAKNINSYELARKDLIKKMMVDEQGKYKTLADVTAEYSKTAFIHKAPKEIYDVFEGATSLTQLDTIFKDAQTAVQKQYDATKGMEASIKIIEQSASMTRAYQQTKTNMLDKIMRDEATGKYTTFEQAAVKYKVQALTPGEMSQEALESFKKASTREDLDKKLEEMTAPLREEYDKSKTTLGAAAILEKQAKILNAYEEAKKGIAETPIATAEAISTATATTTMVSLLEKMLIAANQTATSIKILTGEATEEGSLYVEDAGLKDMLSDRLGKLPTVTALTDTPLTGVTPTLPGMAKDAEEEIRKRKAEIQNNSDADMARTEENTGSTAANTGAMVGILKGGFKGLAKVFGQMMKRGLGVDGPDYPTDAFFEEVLNTEWPNARNGRTVGFESNISDFS